MSPFIFRVHVSDKKDLHNVLCKRIKYPNIVLQYEVAKLPPSVTKRNALTYLGNLMKSMSSKTTLAHRWDMISCNWVYSGITKTSPRVTQRKSKKGPPLYIKHKFTLCWVGCWQSNYWISTGEYYWVQSSLITNISAYLSAHIPSKRLYSSTPVKIQIKTT